MNFGFNSNVRVGNTQYHVQTEDRGEAHPFLTTVVYQGGRVVHKRNTDYKGLVAGAGDPKAVEDQLHTLLSKQHKEVIALLEGGYLNLESHAANAPSKSMSRLPEALRIEFENPTSWLVSGKVVLEVRVLRNNTGAESAEVVAFIEDTENRSEPCYSRTDSLGLTELKFPMPASVSDGATLVIRAMLGKDRGELRFRLKPSKGTPAPVLPSA
jgi:hypothetical protein